MAAGKKSVGPGDLPRLRQDALEKFRRAIYLPDPMVLDFVWSVCLVNATDSEPLWGGIIGPPGDTKTVFIRSVSQHEKTYSLSNLTPRTLVSGLKETDDGKEPSLVPRLDRKTLLIKDFTLILDLPPMVRNEIMATFRDAYDGEIAMAYGTGQTKRFQSKFGLLIGCTPAIEEYWGRYAALGERFLWYRQPGCLDSSYQKAMSAVSSVGDPAGTMAALQAASNEILDVDLEIPRAPIQNKNVLEFLYACSYVLSVLRTPVAHHGKDGILYKLPESEIPTRIIRQLAVLAYAASRLHGSEPDNLPADVASLVRRTAWQSAPGIRRRIVSLLYTSDLDLATLREFLRLDYNTTRRHLDDMEMIGAVSVDRSVRGKPVISLARTFSRQLNRSGIMEDASAQR